MRTLQLAGVKSGDYSWSPTHVTLTGSFLESNDTPKLEQSLSTFVRARLLFKREIEIDRGGKSNLFDADYLRRMIEIKGAIDRDVAKILVMSVASTFGLYLLGTGADPSVPILGLPISKVPGALILLSLLGSYTLAMSAFLFLNSQTYAAAIDQIILDISNNGLVDADIIKASYERDWLVFKLLRREFSFHAAPHIEMGRAGRIFNSAAFILFILIILSPYFALILIQPYLNIVFLQNGIISTATKLFSILCAASVVYLLVITNWPFKCKTTLLVSQPPSP